MMKPKFYIKIVGLLLAAVLFSACRGQVSEKPQVQPIQNMYWQQKFKAFEPNDFFDDRRSMRLPVEGTIPRGHLKNDKAVFAGLNPDDSFVQRIPIEVNMDLLKRGQQQYNISCAPCHGYLGVGDGIVISRGYVPPPSFYDDRIIEMPDGEIYSAIYNGINSMPSYRNMVKRADDRWAVVAYIRALQASQRATDKDLEYLNINAADFVMVDEPSQSEMVSN
jgi:mono/diheme cytochrome c family protein